jgi:hypothetical protein
MKRFRLILGGLILCLALTAATCNPNAQRTAYNTVYSAEQAATSAYSGYWDLVIKGKVTTNSVPSVSAKFNVFQRTVDLATSAVAFNPTNPAPADVTAALNDVLAIIDAVKKGALK